MYTGKNSVIKSRADDKFLYHQDLTSSHALFSMAFSPKFQVSLKNFKTGTNSSFYLADTGFSPDLQQLQLQDMHLAS